MCDFEINIDLGTSGCGRKKSLSVFQGCCDRCGLGQKVIISTNSSDGEYESIDVCTDCIKDLKHDFISRQKEDKDVWL